MVEDPALDPWRLGHGEFIDQTVGLHVPQQRERSIEHPDIVIGRDDDGADAPTRSHLDGVALFTAGRVRHGALDGDVGLDAEQAGQPGHQLVTRRGDGG